jgi:dienelactone hydrolase
MSLHDYADAETTCQAYVALPEGPGPHPCVLVAHDWAGRHPGMHEIADRMAALGYVGFALDVYGEGKVGDLAGDNSALMMPFVSDRAKLRRRLLAALRTAQDHPAVDASRVAAIGYCFGGLCVLDLARAVPDGLKGVVSIHGLFNAPEGLGEQPPITASVLALHGWADPMAKPDSVLALAAEMDAAKADWQIHAFGHALHAFTNPGANNPAGGVLYDAKADRRSTAIMTDFLAEVLA